MTKRKVIWIKLLKIKRDNLITGDGSWMNAKKYATDKEFTSLWNNIKKFRSRVNRLYKKESFEEAAKVLVTESIRPLLHDIIDDLTKLFEKCRKDKNFINRATKGVYEFGSVFKTFTLAAGFNEKLIEPKDMFNNLEKKIKDDEIG